MVALVAEIGCNHQGDVFNAKHMIHIAAECGVDVIKGQKRHPLSLPKSQYEMPYTGPHSFGPTYGKHREALELPIYVHKILAEQARGYGIEYTVSVWDITSLGEVLNELGKTIPYLKIPSAKNSDWEFLLEVKRQWAGSVHVSNGMIELADERRLVKMFAGRLVLYACTAAYPADHADIKLGDLVRFRREYGSDLAGIGFSGHHRGIALDAAAVALGAEWIERHFTLDRTWKGTDHAASLEPPGLSKLRRDIHAVAQALGERKGVLYCEQGTFLKMKGGICENGEYSKCDPC